MQTPLLKRSLLEFNEYAINGERILIAVIISLVVWVVYGLLKRTMKRYLDRHEISERRRGLLWRFFKLSTLVFWIMLILFGLDIDKVLLLIGNIDFKISNLLQLLFILLVAKIADNIISARISEEIIHREDDDTLSTAQSLQDQRISVTRSIQYSLIAIVLIIILPIMGLDFNLESITINEFSINITLTKIISAVLVLLIARILIWLLINVLLFGWYRRQRLDLGKQYAYNQLLTYVIYLIAFIIALQYLGFNLTLMWASAAAILVGVGFALQQTINDFFCGLVLLFERSVEAGDFLDFGTFKGTVKKIGLRSSIVETLERRDIIIPNSKMVNENVINWTKGKSLTRFKILVSVAYGSDTVLVKDLLLKVAVEADGVLVSPKPFVRFLDFGNHGLQFGLYFFSMAVTKHEDIQSDIRFQIDEVFRQHEIVVPFPQQDVWIRNRSED